MRENSLQLWVLLDQESLLSCTFLVHSIHQLLEHIFSMEKMLKSFQTMNWLISEIEKSALSFKRLTYFREQPSYKMLCCQCVTRVFLWKKENDVRRNIWKW